MDKTIATALLIAVTMIMAMLLFNVAYPAVINGGDAVSSMASNIADRMRNNIDIIHASAELDDTGWWQDTNGNSQFDVFVWVKNIGTMRIPAITSIDVFFGPEGNFTRIPYQDNSGGNYPYWTWKVENGTDWVPTATLQIDIHNQAPLSSGRYYLRITLPDGVSSDLILGI